MRNLAYPFALSFAVLSIHAGVPVGAGWTNARGGLTSPVPGVTALVIDWTALGNIAAVNFIALDPTSSSTVYAGTGHGVVLIPLGPRIAGQTMQIESQFGFLGEERASGVFRAEAKAASVQGIRLGQKTGFLGIRMQLGRLQTK